MTRIIEPTKGNILAKLSTSEYGDIPVPEKDYDSITWGTVVATNEEDKEEYGYLLGRQAYWRRFKDDCRIADEKTLVLIEINDILGSSYESTDTSSING